MGFCSPIHVFVLHLPHCGGKKKRAVIHSLIFTRLRQWQDGDLVHLWESARFDVRHVCNFRNDHCSPNAESIKRNNIWKGSEFIQHGRYGQAMQC